MPLSREQDTALKEIVWRARRIYRSALTMQKAGEINVDKLADAVIDASIAKQDVDTLWRQVIDEAREAHHATATAQVEAIHTDEPDVT